MTDPQKKPDRELPPFRTIRHDEVHGGSLSMLRTTHVYAGGNFQNELEIRQGNDVFENVSWTVDAQDSHDNLLKVADYHWKHARKDFKMVGDLSHMYYELKSKEPDKIRVFERHVMEALRERLVEQPVADPFWLGGVIVKDRYPIYRATEVLDNIRALASNRKSGYGVKLDGFEMKMKKLLETMDKAERAYDDAVMPKDEDFGESHQKDDEPDWRSMGPQVEKKNHGGTLEPWEQKPEKDAVDLAYEIHKEALAFGDVANQIWFKAASAIRESQKFEPKEDDMRLLRVKLNRVHHLYNKMKEETFIGDQPPFEFRDYHEVIRNELIPELHQIQAVIAQPVLFADIVRKGMPKQHGRDS